MIRLRLKKHNRNKTTTVGKLRLDDNIRKPGQKASLYIYICYIDRYLRLDDNKRLVSTQENKVHI